MQSVELVFDTLKEEVLVVSGKTKSVYAELVVSNACVF